MNLRNLIYPPRCPFCGKIRGEEGPCPSCLQRATELTAVVCHICGADPEHCKCGGRNFSFRRNVSAFIYDRSPRHLLLRFKQRGKPQLAEFMGRRMYYHVKARYKEDFSAITYVPQTWWKGMCRGFCPAQLLAEELSVRLELPCVKVLKRRKGRQQKYLHGNARWQNAKKSYALFPGAEAEGKVLLVDDLMTSGATLSACAELLREAGAAEVYCATFAIAVKKS